MYSNRTTMAVVKDSHYPFVPELFHILSLESAPAIAANDEAATQWRAAAKRNGCSR